MSNDKITIPELKVSLSGFQGWQERWEQERPHFQARLDHPNPIAQFQAQYHLHLLDVDTAPPFNEGDVITHAHVGGRWVVVAIDGEWLGTHRVDDKTNRGWFHVNNCSHMVVYGEKIT